MLSLTVAACLGLTSRRLLSSFPRHFGCSVYTSALSVGGGVSVAAHRGNAVPTLLSGHSAGGLCRSSLDLFPWNLLCWTFLSHMSLSPWCDRAALCLWLGWLNRLFDPDSITRCCCGV